MIQEKYIIYDGTKIVTEHPMIFFFISIIEQKLFCSVALIRKNKIVKFQLFKKLGKCY